MMCSAGRDLGIGLLALVCRSEGLAFSFLVVRVKEVLSDFSSTQIFFSEY